MGIRHVFTGALVLGMAACHATGTFACERDDQCGAGGSCEPTGYCSFADTTCPSGSRYDTYAGGGLANDCVGGAVDGGVATTDGACVTYSTQLDTCSVSGTGGALELSGANTYDTDTDTLVTPDGSSQPIRVVVVGPASTIHLLIVDSFHLAAGGSLRVTGASSFGIASSGTVVVDGTIDLTAGGAGGRSAGIVRPPCVGGNGASASTVGGGGGGGFRGAGGGGSKGLGGAVAGGTAGAAAVRPLGLVGGCDGGSGNRGFGGGGFGGGGGGGIVIASGVSIVVTAAGVITVGGGGGVAGMVFDDGGGGGGSGGMILLEAAAVVIDGMLAANGGGGGEGGASFGSNGATGLPSTLPAAGGKNHDGDGGDGGDGGAGSLLDGVTSTDVQNGGGGGGGGGVGYIAIAYLTVTGTGQSSPSFELWP